MGTILVPLFAHYRPAAPLVQAAYAEGLLAARRWLRQFIKTKALSDKGSSYGLKHVAEHDIGYITNGVFIAAAIAEGFTVRRIRDTPNAQINISAKAWATIPHRVYA